MISEVVNGMASRTQRKCQWCKEYGNIDEMIYILQGKTKKFYHQNCYQEYLKDKEFKAKERQELDELVEVIKKVFGVKRLPNSVYPYLQDIRNGTQFFGKYNYKYKNGYSYKLIAETFDYCEYVIQDSIRRKGFNDFMTAFKYGLAIVVNKLPFVERKKQEAEMRKAVAESFMQNIDIDDLTFTERKRQSSRQENDISEFLDD